IKETDISNSLEQSVAGWSNRSPDQTIGRRMRQSVTGETNGDRGNEWAELWRRREFLRV
ncbi:hypothetical protein TorRG33x02_199060, partial [Trema orientale]